MSLRLKYCLIYAYNKIRRISRIKNIFFKKILSYVNKFILKSYGK